MEPQTAFTLIGLTIAISQSAHAGPPAPQPKPAHLTLSQQDKQHLFYDTFTLARTVRQIPEPVQARLLAAPIRKRRDMADFGQHFDASDVVGNRPPVFYRLIFSATSPEYCLVYYEHGGIAHSHKVDFFRLSGGKVVHLWGADLQGLPSKGGWTIDPTTLAQLRTEIRHGHYDTAHRF